MSLLFEAQEQTQADHVHSVAKINIHTYIKTSLQSILPKNAAVNDQLPVIFTQPEVSSLALKRDSLAYGSCNQGRWKK